jgi:hypothetical protein
MNYTYTIENSNYSSNEKKITELLNNKLNRVWYINQLKNAQRNWITTSIGNSFQRARDWVIQNHPELLL